MNKGKKSYARELVKDIIIAGAIVAALSFFIRPTLVKETSMEPTIQPNSYLIMSKRAYSFNEIQRGDIIVFKSDTEFADGKNKLLIKRVIGIPGDIITITGGKVWLNGSEVRESYIAAGGTPGNIYNLEVHQGQVFVMGDHRVVSIDSRKFGCISKSSIVGKAVFRLFPFNEIGAIHSKNGNN